MSNKPRASARVDRPVRGTLRISRRALIKGMLGGAVVSIGLPPLELFMNSTGTAYADGATGFPKRFGLFFWGNGNIPERWNPIGQGSADQWQLSEQLAPLKDLKDEISVISGMRVYVPNTEPHLATASGMLSGCPWKKVQGNHTFGGPTIDHVIANVVGGETRFSTIEYGIASGTGMSHTGPNSIAPPEENPYKLFERVFGGSFQLPGDEPKIDPSLGLRRSVLDAVMEDTKRLMSRVGAEDNKRLDAHFEGIRVLEKRLAKLQEDPPNLKACALPSTPEFDYPNINGRPQLFEKNSIMAETMAMALACDQTRVFSNTFTRPVNNRLFPGATQGHHQLTHNEPGEQPEVNTITTQCVKAYAELVTALKKVKEGQGTLLDSCLVMGTSDVSLGKTHNPEDMPVLFAGSCGGELKTNVHYRSPSNENASMVLLTAARAMGLDLAEFGSEEGRVDSSVSAVEV
mgnify:CR=1 FL=1